jgi:hypothetical protein
MSRPDQLTIRGFDPELERRIRELAEREGISLNKAVLRLLRRGAGLEVPPDASNAIGAALDDLIGTWSDGEADALRSAVEVFESIDEALWR